MAMTKLEAEEILKQIAELNTQVSVGFNKLHARMKKAVADTEKSKTEK